MALTITINGQQKVLNELAAGATVLEMIAALGFQGDRIALELNGVITPRTAWSIQSVKEADRVELVHFVGGGSQ